MKSQLSFLLAALTVCAGLHRAAAQGTAFTYQGQLNINGNPANGSYDLSFSLYKVSSGGGVLAGPLTNSATGVTNGLFTVSLDFGSNVFNGASYWLDISARTNGNGAFTELSPRQQLTPAPYSVFSANAGAANTANGVAAGAVTATGIGSGQVVKSLNGLEDAVTLSPGANVTITPSGNTLTIASSSGGGGGWSLTGNSGVSPTNGNFLGTSDNNPLELWVGDARAMRLEPDISGNNKPNVILGSSNNASYGGTGVTIGGGYNNGAVGASTISGGQFNFAYGGFDAVGGGDHNTVNGQYSIIGGGRFNTNNGILATIAGGGFNTASGPGATVGGGGFDGVNDFGNGANRATGPASVVAGGLLNTAGAAYATVSGGSNNLASGAVSTVSGGWNNAATGPYSTVAGGSYNGAFGQNATVAGGGYNIAQGYFSFAAGNEAEALHDGSFVWADSVGGTFYSTANDQFSVRAEGGVRFITAGAGMTIDGVPVSTGGGTNGWNLNGNAGTDPSVNFLGTSDGAELVLKAGNLEGLRLTASQDLILQRPSQYSDFSRRNGLGVYGFTSAIDGGSRIFANQNVLGPVLYGEAGGGLGVISQTSQQTLALEWSTFGISLNLPTTIFGNTTINGNVGINTATPRQALDVNGGFVEIQGNGAQTAIGGLGATAVVIGSFNPSVSGVSFVNLNTFSNLDLTCGAINCHPISCSTITIRGGADLAEPFQISSADKEIPQGAVVVIDEENPGRLRLSDQPYDTRVAGVVSGANGVNPGIQMQQQGVLEGGKNVALTGRVYVQADAANGVIRPGDLLTTSGTPGYAMKVSDHAKAQGAILGKAMTGLSEGKGMVLVLVTLQ